MFVIVSILLVISIIDFKIKIIPNQLNVLLFISGIWSGFVFQEVTFLSRFLGVFSVSIPMFILAILCSGGLGGGDVKLMAASGVLLGIKWNIFAACAGLLLGGLYGFFQEARCGGDFVTYSYFRVHADFCQREAQQ